MDFTSPIKWNGIEITLSELRELNSLAINAYTARNITKETAWVEAMLMLLNRKGLLKFPETK